MKILSAIMLMSTLSVHASPLLSVKERLRLHMWVYGLEDQKPVKQKAPQKQLPEEIERALRKI